MIADPNRLEPEGVAALGPDSRVKWTHSGLEADSEMHQGVTEGWPAVLSNLKTLLETGETLSDELW